MKERIRKVMEYAGMTQQDFANRLSISPASLSGIFTGRTNPTNNHVMAVHAAFPEINVNWLMFGEGQMINENTNPNVANAPQNAPNSSRSEANALRNETAADGVSTISITPSEPASPSLFDASPAPQPTLTPSEQRAAAYGSRRTTHNPYAANVVQPYSANNNDKPTRKIREIRVFFSDGTYESFVPSSR